MGGYDAIVIGGGIGGACAGAILASSGNRVLLLEREPDVAGRLTDIPYKGHTINSGGHFLGEPDEIIGKIYEYAGLKLEYTSAVGESPIYRDGRWTPAREFFKMDKGEYKKVIDAIISSSFEELAGYDDWPLRSWLRMHTEDPGTIAMFENICRGEFLMTDWFDFSAGETLIIRKMYFERWRRPVTALWPRCGLKGTVEQLVEVIRRGGGEVKTQARVVDLILKGGRVQGVKAVVGPKAFPEEYPEAEEFSADAVISTVPVWALEDFLPKEQLPWSVLERIRFLSRMENRILIIGFYAATDKPIYAMEEKGVHLWERGARTGLPGYAYLQSAFDPSMSPPGEHLLVAGGFVDGSRFDGSRRGIERLFEAFVGEVEEMLPDLKGHTLWRSRHLYNYNLASKPGFTGKGRLPNTIPGLEGLYLCGDGIQARGVGTDRAARGALKCAEMSLGKEVPFFQGVYRG
jgi:phytoene dehydrogenase-like protein